MKVLFQFISYFLSLVPKSNKILVFSSFPDFADNAFAVYQYLKKKKGEKYRYIWIYVDKKNVNKSSDIEGYYRYSFWGIYYFLRARYVFCTHGLNSFIHLRQGMKIINLWHGMPLKTIGCLDPQSNGVNPTVADYLVATSPAFQKIMSQSFNNMDLDRVLLVGQPRNDLLFEPTNYFMNNGISVSDYDKIGIWLPTYRQSIIGDIRVDGLYNEGGISFFSMKNLQSLDEFLVKTANLLLIKLHPMDALQNVDFPHFSNIRIIKQKDFSEQLYPLLGASSYLLTDYSSVWVDYLIMRKPIGFVMNDCREYSESRGFTIEQMERKLPGVVIDSVDKLYQFIISPSMYNEQQANFFNIFVDNKSSERLVDFLKL
ncbi:CDP-glycerol glycerophosphotransferase family protein [Bacteroides uniformis]|jgi:CDP-glycerol glycerophosphotransferase (TagB/SpsB family)|uniref:CDP-glycerol:poly(Glycerophosphate) glycerophosphotransferase n=1 Tax=Bacteroides uniformis TaxID=820 RepID=A0A1Y3VAD2_BACUN|nr:CDP-glycerol glycerophosphotransferase family protein [Bacteroides uniformis]OUN55419.1 hypothetical protein B5G17_06795 [Bacteroides uniformis]